MTRRTVSFRIKHLLVLVVFFHSSKCIALTHSDDPNVIQVNSSVSDINVGETLSEDEYEDIEEEDLTKYQVNEIQSTKMNNSLSLNIELNELKSFNPENEMELPFIKPVILPEIPKKGFKTLKNQVPVVPTENSGDSQPVKISEEEEEPESVFEEPETYANEQDIMNIQSKIQDVAKKLMPNREIESADKTNELERLSKVLTTIEDLGKQVDLIKNVNQVGSKHLLALETQYEDLWYQMKNYNDTLNKHFEQNSYNRTQIAILLLKDNQIETAAKEVDKIYDDSKIPDIVAQFYGGLPTNIVKLIDFSYHLSKPYQEIISFHALYEQMAKHKQKNNPGILPILDRIVEIERLSNFQEIKHASGIARYNAFVDNLQKEEQKLLTKWQNNIKSCQYNDIVTFASMSKLYSNSLNKNMIRLLWIADSFENKTKFLNALPHTENRIAGYKIMNDLYKNHHLYENMVKLAVTVRREMENAKFNSSVLGELTATKEKFWAPVKKLVWSKSCFIKHLWTGRYLTENKIVHAGVTRYDVETSLTKTNESNYRWDVVPLKEIGKFEIRNVEYRHSLSAQNETTKDFGYWPRRIVNLDPDRASQTAWKALIVGRDEKYTFEADSCLLTTGGTFSYEVFADDIFPLVQKDYNLGNFVKLYHQWDLEC